MTEVLIGIDMGTGSSKAVLALPDGCVLATASRLRTHSMQLPRPGWAEIDPEAVWWADVIALCRDLIPHLGGRRIAGVCVSGVGPCLVLCDDADVPVRPGILYGIDMRATAEIAGLTEELGEQAVLDRCGKALSTQAVGPKLAWVARHEPDVWARATHWYGSSSYIVRKLTGAYIQDHHTASQCDPLYDVGAGDWYRPWADPLVAHLGLPRLAWPAEVVGEVTAEAARLTGLPPGTSVCAGTVDAWAEAFSAGVRAPGDAMLMYGSTLFLVSALDGPVTAPGLWTTAGVEPGSYTLSAGLATSGSLTAWLQDLTGGAPYGELVAEAAAVPAGADGLLMLPYFAGERTPIFDPRARGVVAGLSLRHRRGHLFRAVYEGSAYGVRQILELLDDAAPITRLVAVGGGTQGGLWTRIISDVTGRPQVVPAETIGGSYGDALLAAIGTGLVPPETDWARPDRVVVPDPARAAVYDRLYARYTELYPATRSIVHDLAVLQEQGADSG